MSRDEDELLKAERRRMAAAFDDVLREPVPERFTTLLQAPAAPVVELAEARARRQGMPGWAAWGGMAATLVLGTLLGARLAAPGGDALDPARLVATGDVARALETRLAADRSGPVSLQISFKARDGRYCRTFTTAAHGGLACRAADGAWTLEQVAALAPATTGGMQQAATALPATVLAAVDAVIGDGALDAEQERAARDAGWRR